MRNKFYNLFLILIFLVPSFGGAQETDYSNLSSTPPEGTAIGEAATATFHRVFGQDGKSPDINYYVYDVYQPSPGNAAFRSALLPGWGQGFNGQKVKGALIFGAFLGTAWGAVALNNSAEKSLDEYRAVGLKNGDKFDDYERQETQSIILGVVAGLLYAFSVYDAYRNAYTPLWSDSSSIQLGLAPDLENGVQGQMSYRRRF